jgi:NAD(P)-dependent dehydrogenase (short-subunit alcohol dehydrogenase family)
LIPVRKLTILILHLNHISSVFLAIKHAAPAMQITSPTKPYSTGSIIATSSTAGLRSNGGSTDYSAAKAGVISVIQTACFQLAGRNIRCNAICPGMTETGMTAPVFYDPARKRGTESKIGQLCPLKRGAVADEIARVALFLGTDEASYVNGQAWAVDGGLSSGLPYMLGTLA